MLGELWARLTPSPLARSKLVWLFTGKVYADLSAEESVIWLVRRGTCSDQEASLAPVGQQG